MMTSNDKLAFGCLANHGTRIVHCDKWRDFRTKTTQVLATSLTINQSHE